MNGKKIHTFVDDGHHSYTPCGMSISYYHAISVDSYSKVDVGNRCKRCDEFYQKHLKGFLEVDRVYYWDHHPCYYFIVLSCGYGHKGTSSYENLLIQVIKFDDDLSYIKQTTFLPTLYTAERFKNKGIDMTKDKIEFIKKLYRIINK